MDLYEFIDQYINCALWSSPGENVEFLDALYTGHDMAPETIQTIIIDCKKFIEHNAKYMHKVNHYGHDFWLTRNDHGAGFWDGDYVEPYATQLTNYCAKVGSCDLYVGDDNQLYIM